MRDGSRRAGAALLLGLLLGACASGSGRTAVPRDEAGCAWRVCLGFEDTPAGRTYVVVNREPVPATVLLSFRSMENLRATESFPIERVIAPESRGVLVELHRVRQGRGVNASPSVFIDLGSRATEPDMAYMYAVPFGGRNAQRVIQSFNGDDTHREGMRYSIDIEMPQGTPILAARAGTVLYTQDGFTRGGRDPDLLERSNLIVIAHEDGSMASYGHLSPGLAVERGDVVEEGDFLGFSGMTGFTGQPHLHFHVGVKLLSDPGRTIPFRLKGIDGNELHPFEGAVLPPAPVRRARNDGYGEGRR